MILKCVQPLLKALLRTLHSRRFPPDPEDSIVLMDRWQEMLESNRCLKSFALHIVPFHWKPLSVSREGYPTIRHWSHLI
jgi:hypothetical protein